MAEIFNNLRKSLEKKANDVFACNTSEGKTILRVFEGFAYKASTS